MIRIAIDVMGGDSGPQMTVPAAIQSVIDNSNIEIILVGNSKQIDPLLESIDPKLLSRITVKNATQTIAMDEKPSAALRGKKDSSIHVAMRLVGEGEADAVVSAGNSGALMAVGKYVLKMLPGIDRPAMCAQVPNRDRHCYLLDLGANINCSSEQLYQYAVMGSVVASAVDKLDRPRIGLLNIGEEEIKGNEQIKLAARMLEENTELNYIGYIEGDKIFEQAADVVVCDGFAGNVALKASEGMALLIKDVIAKAFNETWYTRLAGILALPVVNKLASKIDPARYNGASLLGLQGCVVKSHGGTTTLGFQSAIALAVTEAQKNVPALINGQLDKLGC